MIEFCFSLPYPPSVNTYWRHVSIRGARRTLISERGRQYRADVMKAVGKAVSPLQKPLQVRIDAFMPDRRCRDLDNLPKAILDSLTHAGLWMDDSQIDDLRIVRQGVEKPGRVIVTVGEIDGR